MGVDPGLSGALALIDTKTNERLVADMPLTEYGMQKKRRGKKAKAKKIVCGKRLGDLLEEWQPDEAIIERVASRPGQGVSTTFSFGMAYGTAIGAISAMNVPVYFVLPAAWKKTHGLLGTEKDAARKLAIKKFKKLRDDLKLKKHGGRADAALIAEYRLVTRH